jgi:hypothetical protein
MNGDSEPTEEQWAAVGRYLAGRMQSHSLTMDGQASYRFRGGWPDLRGRNIVSAVMRAIVMEDEARKERATG